MLGHGADGQFGIGEVDFGGTAAEVIFLQFFQPLSEPVRTLPGIHPSRQQFMAAPPFPATVSFSWFEPLSEPVRTRPGLKPGQQQFLGYVPNPVTVTPFNWFEALSEPPRFKPGLHASRQQFLAAPAQLRPNPNITGVLAATETKDTMLASARAWNRITSGEMGISVSNAPSAQMGISIVPPISYGKISIRILSS